jgi:hypothetical protein
LLIRVEPLKVKLEGWGDNALKGTPTNLQWRKWERTKMSPSTQRHGTLYRSKETLHTYQEV